MKYLSFLKNNKIFRLLCITLFFLTILGGIIRIFIFSVGINSYDLHDYYEGLFWADATLRSGSPVNPDYIYFYIVPFGANLIMAPFVHFFGFSILANQLGMLVFYIIYLAVLFRLAFALYEDAESRMLFCSIVSLFIFIAIGDNLLHHILCYGIGFVCFLGIIASLVNIDKKRGGIKELILLAVFCLWGAANGIAGAAMCCLPILAGLIISGFIHKTLFNRNKIPVYLAMIIPVIAGLLIFRHLDNSVPSLHMYDVRFIFAGTDEIVERLIQRFIADYLKNFNFEPAGIPMMSLGAINEGIMLLFAFAFTALPFYLIKKDPDSRRDPVISGEMHSLIFFSGLFVMAVAAAQYLFSSVYYGRFLFNGILSLFFLTAFLFTNVQKKERIRLLLLPLLCFAFLMTAKMAFISIPNGESKKAEYARLNDILTEENLPVGYSFDRNHTFINVLSEGKNKNYFIYFDEDNSGKFLVSWDRVYKDEFDKPDNVDRFYFLKYIDLPPKEEEKQKNAELVLEKFYTEKRTVGKLYLYIFNIEDWDEMFTTIEP